MAIPAALLQIARASPMMGQIKNMMGMVRASQNQQAMLNQLAMNNPQLKQVLDIVCQYGGDSDLAFQETAKQMGINPEEIMGMMR